MSSPSDSNSPLLIALRIAPLLGTTASLTHAYMEWITMDSLLAAPNLGSRVSQSAIKNSICTPGPSQHASEEKKPNSATETETETERKSQREEALQRAIPSIFTNWFNKGLWSVIALNSLTTLSAAANIFLFQGYRPALGVSPVGTCIGASKGMTPKKWYMAGLGAAMAHYAFVPGVMPSVAGLIGMCWRQERSGAMDGTGGEKGSAKALVREWLSVHRVRVLTVDVLAWVCFAVGVVGVLGEGIGV